MRGCLVGKADKLPILIYGCNASRRRWDWRRYIHLCAVTFHCVTVLCMEPSSGRVNR